MTYTGDILLQETNGEIDALWENGQPAMTDGFETAVLLAVFGDRNTWQNALADSDEEKYVSRFTEVIRNANVSEKTKKDGTEALKVALAFLVSSRAASKVTVTGKILSVYAVGWYVEIVRPDGTANSRYEVNWQRGEEAAVLREVA